MNTRIRAFAGALVAAALLLPTYAQAQAAPAASAIQVVPASAGDRVQLTGSKATATAFSLTTSEDGGREGFVDLTFTGDGSFSLAANQLRITTDNGATVAVAHTLTQRDAETNLRLREITTPETIPSGETVSLRFEFSAVDHLAIASNLSVLTDASGAPVAAWRAR